MAYQPIQIGPFPLGQDTFHESTHPVFQVGETPPRLTAAVNVDIDDSGHVSRRAGSTERLALQAGQNCIAFNDYLLVQNNGSIWQVDPSDWQLVKEVVTGLSTTAWISFCEHAQQVFYTNGEVCGRIDASFNGLNWGMDAAEAPTLTATGGNLPAGRYMVACTYTDASGVEHGCVEAEVITLSATGGITASVASPPSDAALVNFYVSSTDQDGLFYSQSVAAATPTTASLVDLESDMRHSTDALYGMNTRGPIPGDGVFNYLGFLLIWIDNAIIRSDGTFHHLFYVNEHLTALPKNVLAGVGLETGYWVVTEKGAWFVAGEDPSLWAPMLKDTRAYAKGGLQVSGRLIPSLETSALVALFVSEDGLMAGLPSGQMVALTQDRLPLDVDGKRATIAVREITGIRQIVFTLE